MHQRVRKEGLWGLAAQCYNSGFYFEGNGKPLESFEQRRNNEQLCVLPGFLPCSVGRIYAEGGYEWKQGGQIGDDHTLQG